MLILTLQRCSRPHGLRSLPHGPRSRPHGPRSRQSQRSSSASTLRKIPEVDGTVAVEPIRQEMSGVPTMKLEGSTRSTTGSKMSIANMSGEGDRPRNHARPCRSKGYSWEPLDGCALQHAVSGSQPDRSSDYLQSVIRRLAKPQRNPFAIKPSASKDQEAKLLQSCRDLHHLSPAGTMIMTSSARAQDKIVRRLATPHGDREDTEGLWHARSRYLGLDGLKMLAGRA